jgi:hypothetical protein
VDSAGVGVARRVHKPGEARVRIAQCGFLQPSNLQVRTPRRARPSLRARAHSHITQMAEMGEGSALGLRAPPHTHTRAPTCACRIATRRVNAMGTQWEFAAAMRHHPQSWARRPASTPRKSYCGYKTTSARLGGCSDSAVVQTLHSVSPAPHRVPSAIHPDSTERSKAAPPVHTSA